MKKFLGYNMVVLYVVAMLPQAQAAVPNISDDVWHSIENSEAYQNFPKSRASSVSFDAHVTSNGTGTFKGKRESDESFSMKSTPVGDRCSKVQRSDVPNFDTYKCGGHWSTSGGTSFYLTKAELKGSLFPMKVGAEMRFQSESVTNAGDKKIISKASSVCKVSSRDNAHDLNPLLSGTAWKVYCDSQWSSLNNTKGANGLTDYYLENIGVFLSQIGVMNSIDTIESHDTEVIYMLPSAGSTSKFIVKGEYGSIITKSYDSYNWTVDK